MGVGSNNRLVSGETIVTYIHTSRCEGGVS